MMLKSYHFLAQSALLIIFFLMMLLSCARQTHQAQGYIEGRYTYIATSVSGVLQELLVQRGNFVRRGQLLLTLEEQPESDAYESAMENFKQTIASRDAIIANLGYAKITYERYKVLVPKNAIQQSQLDNAKSIYDATQAQLASANANIASSFANLAEARWKKNQKKLFAPVDAVVFDTYYRLGEYTDANHPIISLLAATDIKAIFYVPQLDLGKLKLNDKITVLCDGCAKPYEARISFISPTAEYTPPLIYSNETNAKLIFRIEAEFKPQDAVLMHPGQPVTVNYANNSS